LENQVAGCCEIVAHCDSRVCPARCLWAQWLRRVYCFGVRVRLRRSSNAFLFFAAFATDRSLRAADFSSTCINFTVDARLTDNSVFSFSSSCFLPFFFRSSLSTLALLSRLPSSPSHSERESSHIVASFSDLQRQNQQAVTRNRQRKSRPAN
jgi:hypothetical protein